ncbi:uncharacterized protein EV420DRAFT_1482324 [Desarmillaria tabescens]|uniref:Uncharacterized protein n=1 Tax=Armillaria tabescens TaxID=1929756 RepID=A0AA39MZN9_ARMTA|nr:uncharacterized protein EV420DRAFT_1482324 [Desarmillaria tabescens]KAK0451984.1 hypothetical protein EV420DRAFT_1482324 [Desarmillaria tabescens]
MAYWVELSADKWMKEEHKMKFDLCIHALLLNKEVSYVPPFTIILEARKNGKACVLFTHPSHCPPSSILNTLPRTCGSITCANSKCIGMWHIKDCWSLHYLSSMV